MAFIVWITMTAVLMASRAFDVAPCSAPTNVAAGKATALLGPGTEVLHTLNFSEHSLDFDSAHDAELLDHYCGTTSDTISSGYNVPGDTRLNNVSAWDIDLGDNFVIGHIAAVVANFSHSDSLELDIRAECCTNAMPTICSENCTAQRTVVATSLRHNSNRSTLNVTCEGNDVISGRHLRLRVTSHYVTLCGVKVIGCLQDDFGNLAKGKPTEQSSTYTCDTCSIDDSKADLAVDGNRTAAWSGHSCAHTAVSSPLPHWWRVDLGRNINISRVTLYNRADNLGFRLQNFFVQVGQPSRQNNVNYTTCYFHDGAVGDGAVVNVSCEHPVCGRYLRVIKQDDDETPLTLCEVEVFRSVPEEDDQETTTKTSTTETAETIETTSTTEIVTPTTETTSSTLTTETTQTTPSPATSPQPPSTNLCACRCVHQTPPTNSSLRTALALLEDEIRSVKKHLLLDPVSIGKKIRKRRSAGDPRASSKAAGVLAVALLLAVALCIVLPDLFSLLAFLWRGLKRE